MSATSRPGGIMEPIERAAQHIAEARLAGRPTIDLPGVSPPRSETEAYAIQTALHRVLAQRGLGGRVGYKIGATTPVMRALLGIPAPAYGGVLQAGVYRDRAVLRRAAFQNPGVECEIAFRMRADTVASAAPYDRARIGRHVDACMAAMEIVDNRYGDYRRVPAPVMMADDFFHAACVLGAERLDWQGIDLAGIGGRIRIDGRIAGAGTGAAVMGHPLEALAWLANRLAADGRALRAGEFVLTGSFVVVQWIRSFPCEAMVEIDGLGSVMARFGA